MIILGQSHATRTTAATVSPALSRVFKLLLLLLAAAGISAHAQFSGPALGTTGASQTAITTDPAVLYPLARDYKIGPGDLLTVRLFEISDYTPVVRVGLDGTVQLPLLGAVAVQGLTVPEAETLIGDRLRAAGMYRNPQVNITVTESPNQVVTVLGEVHAVIPITGSRRLLDALAVAGGLPATASHIITINRPGVDQPIVVDLGTDPGRSSLANIPVFPGDTIIVSRVGVVYVLGAFKSQGAIPIQQNAPLTLMQVAALSGGPGFEGHYSDLRIIRTVGLDRKLVKVDIGKVINGKAPDPVLQANDIVFLPTSPMKAVIKSGGVSTLIGVVSLLLFSIQ